MGATVLQMNRGSAKPVCFLFAPQRNIRVV